VLAIGPIVGVAWFSVQSWNRSGSELADLDARVRPVSAAFQSYQLANLLSRTSTAVGAAALPDASAELLALAEAQIETFNDSWGGLVADLEPLAADLASGLGESPETTLGMANFVSELAASELSDHELGEPPSQALSSIVSLARDQMATVVAPSVTTGDDRVRDAEELLIAMIALDADFGHDLQLVNTAGFNGIAVDQAELRSYDLRRISWEDSTSTWVTGFRSTTAAGVESGDFDTSTDNDPIKIVVGDLAALSREGEDLGPTMLEAIELEELLSQQLVDAHDHVQLTAADVRSELRSGRNLAAGASVLMLLLGAALFGLTLNETRARRRVGAAHKGALAEMERKAHADPMTGLHNRRWLDGELPSTLANRSVGTEVALTYMDLDRFKSINDVWGHHVGDKVLEIVGQRLADFTWEGRPVCSARFGGDEFVGFVEVPSDMPVEDLGSLGTALIDTIAQTVFTDGKRHEIDASVGVTMSVPGSTARTLLLEADTALLEAKRIQRGRANVYDREHTRVGELMQALPEALSNGEISMHLQPVFDTATRTVRHYEALARWTRPDGESVRPDAFVSLAESFGLTESLTRAVLLNIRRLLDATTNELPRIWINISPVEFNGRQLATRLLAMLDELGIPTDQIGIEVTESAAIGDQVSTGRELAKLRSRGVKVAIDDFGAGYSPLGHLRQLPIDLLKIDRSLISDVDRDPGAQMMVSGIVGFAHGLGIEVLAEGVERPEELAFIADQGISLVQGYLLGRPVAPEAIKWDDELSDPWAPDPATAVTADLAQA
jgi:diguanylate cyclase (GGDEF)-like protein